MGTDGRILEWLQCEVSCDCQLQRVLQASGAGRQGCPVMHNSPIYTAGMPRTSASGASGSKTPRDLCPSFPLATSCRTFRSLFRYADISTCTLKKHGVAASQSLGRAGRVSSCSTANSQMFTLPTQATLPGVIMPGQSAVHACSLGVRCPADSSTTVATLSSPLRSACCADTRQARWKSAVRLVC
jgi:hypothetical protein